MPKTITLDLKPCPFCASKSIATPTNVAEQAQHPGGVPYLDTFYLACQECGADGPVCDHEPAAIEAWNRRVAPAVREALDVPDALGGDVITATQYFLDGLTRKLTLMEALQHGTVLARLAVLPKSALPKPCAWVIPGPDMAMDNGAIDCMAWETGEFTKPLYEHPAAAPPERVITDNSDVIATLQAEVERLRTAERGGDSDRTDAERWRWLRNFIGKDGDIELCRNNDEAGTPFVFYISYPPLDSYGSSDPRNRTFSGQTFDEALDLFRSYCERTALDHARQEETPDASS